MGITGGIYVAWLLRIRYRWRRRWWDYSKQHSGLVGNVPAHCSTWQDIPARSSAHLQSQWSPLARELGWLRFPVNWSWRIWNPFSSPTQSCPTAQHSPKSHPYGKPGHRYSEATSYSPLWQGVKPAALAILSITISGMTGEPKQWHWASSEPSLLHCPAMVPSLQSHLAAELSIWPYPIAEHSLQSHPTWEPR